MTEGDPLPDVEVTGGMFGIIHIHQPIGVNIFIYADQARKLISDLEKLLERRRPNGGRKTMDVAINQMFRDKYPGQEKRTIRLTEVLPNGVNAIVVTDTKGERPASARRTTLMFKTLRAGYTLVQN